VFNFGKSKSKSSDATPEAAVTAPTFPSEQKQAMAAVRDANGGADKIEMETLSAFDGNAEVLADAVAAARAQVGDLQVEPAAHNSASATLTNTGNKNLITPEKTQETPQTTSAETQGAAGAAKDGSPFTLPTPGGKEKTVAQLFGEIVWLFSQSPKHKNFFVSDLEWLVMTPILLRQFRVFYAPDRPIGVALWAYVNDTVEERLKSGHARLAPADWKSGETLWLVDIVAPFGGHDAMIKDLKEKVFPEREMKFLGLEDGKVVVKEV
jgi:cytolysin-activating lysine-acyltransferase